MAESPVEPASVTVSAETDGGIRLAIRGRLDATTVGQIGSQVLDPVRHAPSARVVIDAAELTYCDGAGLGLFAELRRIVAPGHGRVEFTNLTADLQRLVDMTTLADPAAAQLTPVKPPNLATKVGMAVADLWTDIADLIAFTGQLTVTLLWAICHPFQVRSKDLWVVAEKVGANALPVIILLGGLVGLIMAFQTAIPLQRYGAISVIPSIVGISMTRELSPLITAIIIAGRSGSAFAAEIGTMRVTEELDALDSLGLDPMRFLVVPRVIAAVLMTPLLTVFNILAGLLCGYVVMAEYGYSFRFYIDGIISSVSYVDLLGGVGKTLVFGLIIGAIGCLRGLRTKTGPSAVGDSTTRSVVAGIVLIIIADMIFGIVYFHLGI